MKITQKKVTIRELSDKYNDKGENGVIGYGGKLNIRPAYQREFVYKDKQREAVIDTVTKGLPLNSMYWADNNGNYEILDGQQRTISICQYVEGDFSINYKYFHNLSDEEQKSILDYELFIYACTGTDGEKLAWFHTINIAGEKLTPQEVRNAVYVGPWLADAKKYFSRTNSPAAQKGKKYLKGSPIRQDFLETALKWINDGKIEDYMSKHQHDKDAKDLWRYFEDVIDWVESTFTEYRAKEMKGVPWGELYNKYKDSKLNAKDLEKEITKLMKDFDVTKKSGIYSYVLNGEEKLLNIRAFNAKQKREAYEKSGGICPICLDDFDIEEMEADHITPWSEGGKTDSSNCQMLCKKCNREKGAK
jgi:hypothetical protein